MPANHAIKSHSYRLHKPSGNAVVTLPSPFGGRGRDVYLGQHGSPESRRLYAKAIAEWKAAGQIDRPPDITCDELIAIYAQYCRIKYDRGRRLAIAAAMRPLQELYGPEPAAAFNGPALMAVRVCMVEQFKWCRNTVNEQVRWIRAMFKWGVGCNHVPGPVLFALQPVSAIRPGELGVTESEPVKPVDDASIAAIERHAGRSAGTWCSCSG